MSTQHSLESIENTPVTKPGGNSTFSVSNDDMHSYIQKTSMQNFGSSTTEGTLEFTPGIYGDNSGTGISGEYRTAVDKVETYNFNSPEQGAKRDSTTRVLGTWTYQRENSGLQKTGHGADSHGHSEHSLVFANTRDAQNEHPETRDNVSERQSQRDVTDEQIADLMKNMEELMKGFQEMMSKYMDLLAEFMKNRGGGAGSGGDGGSQPKPEPAPPPKPEPAPGDDGGQPQPVPPKPEPAPPTGDGGSPEPTPPPSDGTPKPGPSDAGNFTKWDTNGSGLLEYDEVKEGLSAYIAQQDADGDGLVTRQEMAKNLKPDSYFNRLWDLFDENKNGLDADEGDFLAGKLAQVALEVYDVTRDPNKDHLDQDDMNLQPFEFERFAKDHGII